MNKILVTGINGFVGKHLTRELNAQGLEVYGLVKESPIDSEIRSLIKGYVVVDLADKDQIEKLDLSGYKAIINLAGLANVGQSFSQADLYMRINTAVLTNLCDRLVAQNLATRIIAVSTGAVYDSNQSMPLKEASRISASGSPYVKSKIAMEKEAEKYRGKGIDCIVARPFNHIGPGQLPGFLVPDLISKIKNSLTNGRPVMVGNLKTKRDYTDVRDVVKAYTALATKNLEDNLFNICSGRSLDGEKILKMLLDSIPGAKDVKVKVDQSLIRPSDPADIYGSYERLKSAAGWAPTIKIDETINDILKV